jgi:hypothetical protein
MSTTPPPAGPWAKWLRFWFAPVDPTPLGLIRLITGFAAVYVHLAYSFDLRAFFGPDGWYSLAAVNRERREMPTVLSNFFENAWTDTGMRGAHLPEYPHRRAAVMGWFRGSAETPPAELRQKLAYLDFLQKTRDDLGIRDGLLYVQSLSDVDQIRKAQLQALVDEGLRKPPVDVVPPVLARLPQDAPAGQPSRTALAKDVEAFVQLLPKDANDRLFVLNHLMEMDQPNRDATIGFMLELAGVDAAKRAELLEYMDHWNQEAKYATNIGSPIFSQWFHITDPTGMAVAHGVIVFVMFLFAIGFCTRVTSVLTWLAAIGYIHRTQQVLFGMDTMMNILLVYLMVGNSGAALSVDRLIMRYRASRNSLRKHGHIDAATRAFLDHPPPSVSAGFALRLLQDHFCFIYMASGLSKLKGAAWWNTNAYWDTLVNPEFTMIHYQWYEAAVRQLTAVRPVYQAAAAFMVVFTFVTEIGLPFMVWTRMRPVWVTLGIILHAGIAVFMGLWVFSLLMMTMLLGYLPGRVMRDRLFGHAAGAPKLTVRVNRKSDRQSRAAALVTMADFDGQVTLADGPGFAVEADGRTVTGRDAARELFGKLTWLRSVGWVLWVPGVGGAVSRALTGAEPSAAAVRPGVPAGS